MRLNDALEQIADIRFAVARARTFRGFRATATLFSAVVAIGTAAVQPLLVPDPAHHVWFYLELWLSVGIICLAIVVAGIVVRYRRSDSPLDRELTLHAFQQFMPCLMMGGLVTLVLGQVAFSSLWIAPGLWAIFFGMGILATRQLLPSGTAFIGMFYLLCGLLSLAWSAARGPFSPWVMGIPFGLGQSMAAGLLYWKLERHDVHE